MRIDLHVHTKHSGHSLLEPEKIARVARSRGLGACAITDHNEVRGAHELSKLMPTVIGEEVSTDRGDITGLFLTDRISPGPVLDVIDSIRAQGGLVLVPHPFDSLRKEAVNSEEICSKADLIEVFNGRVVRGRDNDRARSFASAKGVPGVVGSDAHTAVEVGRCWMELDSIESAAEFMRSVRSARSETRRCPLYVHGLTKLLKLREATR